MERVKRKPSFPFYRRGYRGPERVIDWLEITQLAELGLLYCFSTIVKLFHGRKASRIGEQTAGTAGLEIRGVVRSGYIDLTHMVVEQNAFTPITFSPPK